MILVTPSSMIGSRGTPKHGLTATHTTFWNTTCTGNRGFCIWTQQARYGYVIGTSGSTYSIQTKANNAESTTITDLINIGEGEGKGNTLEPQSLYLDQLQKRSK